ncbi:MAG: hypothetical protein ACRD1P_10480, partial [Thermoanaerobaculia bacterium]
AALSKQRGRKAKRTPEQREIERLERENERLRQELEKAQAIIEVQKNRPRVSLTPVAEKLVLR